MNEISTIHDLAQKALVARIHEADRLLDVEAFLALLAPNVRLRIGSQPPLIGLVNVRQAIAGLFSQVAGIQHHLLHHGDLADAVVFEAEVTFTLKDGRAITLPYVNVLNVKTNGLIEDYRIYIDLAPLYGMVSAGQGGSQ